MGCMWRLHQLVNLRGVGTFAHEENSKMLEDVITQELTVLYANSNEDVSA